MRLTEGLKFRQSGHSADKDSGGLIANCMAFVCIMILVSPITASPANML